MELPMCLYLSSDGEISKHENPTIKQEKYYLGINTDNKKELISVIYQSVNNRFLSTEKIINYLKQKR
jgi:hypothetical protein